MKKAFLPLLLCTAFILCFSGTLFAQDFTIEGYNAKITVFEDSSFTVRETINVRFHRPRHGIYREIPYRYVDELGKTHVTPLDVLSVTDGWGVKRKYRVSQTGNVVNIRIGDADAYVKDEQGYVITYRVRNALLYYEDHDELYWNVTGNYWKADILGASADVSLAFDDAVDELRASCYTGRLGTRESDCTAETSDRNGAFTTTRQMRTGEGLTLALGWPKGFVKEPTALTKFLWRLEDFIMRNIVFTFPVATFCLMFMLWFTRGRDPRVREAVTVMYHPPKHGDRELSPAEVGALVDEAMDRRDISAGIVGLAVKGYIKIEETEKEGLLLKSEDYHLSKLKETDGELSPFESLLMDKLFPGSLKGVYISGLKNQFYKHLDALRDALFGEFVSNKYFLKKPKSVRDMYHGMGIAIIILGIPATMMLSLSGKTFFALMLATVPFFFFGRVMPAKTRAGAMARMSVLGFEEFLERAEKDRILKLGEKDLFFKYLPYAIALDVVDSWARAFEGIYQEAPEWYVYRGTMPRTFSPSTFGRSISSMSTSLADAAFSAPRSSGGGGAGGGFSGGGGSSGGGFGGGGGGSW